MSQRKIIAYGGLFAFPVLLSVPFLIQGNLKLAGAGLAFGIAAVFAFFEYGERKKHWVAKWVAASPDPKPKERKAEEKPAGKSPPKELSRLEKLAEAVRRETKEEPKLVEAFKKVVGMFRRVTPKDKRKPTIGEELELLRQEKTGELEAAKLLEEIIEERVSRILRIAAGLNEERKELQKAIQDMQGEKAAAKKRAQQLAIDVKEYREALGITDPDVQMKRLVELEGKLASVEAAFDPQKIKDSLEKSVRNCALAENMHKRLLQTMHDLETDVKSEYRGKAYNDIMTSLDSMRKTVEETLVQEVRDQHAALTDLGRAIDEFRFASRMFRISEITHERLKHEEKAEELRLSAENALSNVTRLTKERDNAKEAIATLAKENSELDRLMNESEKKLARMKADIASAREVAEKNPELKSELERILGQELDEHSSMIFLLVSKLNADRQLVEMWKKQVAESHEASAKDKARAEALETRFAELEAAIDAGEREKEEHRNRIIALEKEKTAALERQKESIEQAARQELVQAVARIEQQVSLERQKQAELTAEMGVLENDLRTAKSQRDEAQTRTAELEPQIGAILSKLEQTRADLQKTETELNARIAERDREMKELRNIIGFLEAEYGKLLRVIKTKDRDLGLLKESVNDARKNIEESEQKAAEILANKKHSFGERRKKFLIWIAKLREQREELKALNKHIETDRSGLSSMIMDRQRQINDLRDKLTQTELQTNRQLREMEEKIRGLEKLKESLADQNTQLRQRIETTKPLHRTMLENTATEESTALNAELKRVEAENRKIEAELSSANRELARLQQESAETSRKLEKISSDKENSDAAAKAEIAGLSAEVQKHEKEYQEALFRHDQIHGKIAELQHELEQRELRISQLERTADEQVNALASADTRNKETTETLIIQTKNAIMEEKREREKAEKTALDLSNRLKTYSDEVCFLREHYDTLVQELNNEIILRKQSAEFDLNRHTNRAKTLEDEVARLNAQVAQVNQALARLQSNNTQLQHKAGTLSEAEQRVQGIAQQIREKNAEFERVNEQLEVVKRDLQEAKTDLSIETTALNAARQEYIQAMQDVETARQQLAQMAEPVENLDTVSLKVIAAKEKVDMEEFVRGLASVQEQALGYSDEEIASSLLMIRTETEKAITFAEETKVPPIKTFLTKHIERMKLVMNILESVQKAHEEESRVDESSRTQIFEIKDIIQMSVEQIKERFPDIPEDIIYDYDEARNLWTDNLEAALNKIQELSDKLDRLRRPVEESLQEVMHQGVPVKRKFAAGKDKQPSQLLDKEYLTFGQEVIKLRNWIIDRHRTHVTDDRSTQRLYVGRPEKVPVFSLVSGECGEAYGSELTQYETALQNPQQVSNIVFNPSKGKIVFAKMLKNTRLQDQKADVVITAKGDAEEALRKISRKHFQVEKLEHGYSITCFTYDGCPIIEEGAMQWRMLKTGESADLTNIKFIALDIEKRLVLEVSFINTKRAEKSRKLDWYRIVMELKESKSKPQNFGYLDLPRHADVVKGMKHTGERSIMLNRFFTNIGTDLRNNIRVEFQEGYHNLNSTDNKFYPPQKLIDEFNTLISWENGQYYLRISPYNQTGFKTFLNYVEVAPGQASVLTTGNIIHIGENEQTFFIFREEKLDPTDVKTFENKHVAFRHVPNMDCPAVESIFGLLTCPKGTELKLMDNHRYMHSAPGNRLVLNKFGVTVGLDDYCDVIVKLDSSLKDAAGNSYTDLIRGFGFTINRHFGGKHTLTSMYQGGKVTIITGHGQRIDVPENRTAILPDTCIIALREEIGLTLKLSTEQMKNSEELSWAKAFIEMKGNGSHGPQITTPTQSGGGLQDSPTAIIPPEKKSIWDRMKNGLKKKK